MQNILVIGAGRSSAFLINYLLEHAGTYDWKIRVADVDVNLAKEKIGHSTYGEAVSFDINNQEERQKHIGWSNLVVSMLPAHMHISVAKDCLQLKKHLVTASYVSPEMAALHNQVLANDLLFLNEVGLDPGIDHMSAMQVIDELKCKGAEIVMFKSYCGGLVAPESNDNPWGYKFSWNPRNVVLAGQGTAQYIENGQIKYIPYNRVFSQIETLQFKGLGNFEGYANRDSLSYRRPYGLETIPTLLRGTLRYPGYCAAWNVFVKLGWTDDSYIIHNTKGMRYADLLSSFLPTSSKTLRQRLQDFLANDAHPQTVNKLEWLGIFDEERITLEKGTPAQLLQSLLERKWVLNPNDLDLVVMQHIFEYKLNGEKFLLTSSLAVKGQSQALTAMAKTVGLPAAICVKLILQNQLKCRGVQIPVLPEVYIPVLEELRSYGVVFTEEIVKKN